MTATLPAFATASDAATIVASYERVDHDPLNACIFDETGWEKLGGFDWGGENAPVEFDGAPTEAAVDDAIRSAGFTFAERIDYCTPERDGFESWITVWHRKTA